jgi:hypothetical protein
MSERIYGAISEGFQRRMRNWARWEAGDGESLISSAYSNIGACAYGHERPIVIEGEALDTAQDLQYVSIRYRQAVMRFWRYEGASLREHARKLRLGLFHLTFEAWVMKGHDELKAIRAARSRVFVQSHDVVISA